LELTKHFIIRSDDSHAAFVIW